MAAGAGGIVVRACAMRYAPCRSVNSARESEYATQRCKRLRARKTGGMRERGRERESYRYPSAFR